jgi:hypothetical protein
MTEDESAVSTRFDHETVRSASRVAITALALVGVLYLFTLLPGMDRLVPRTPVTFAAVATAVLSLAVVALLVYAAPRLASLARTSLHRAEATDHVETVAENVGGVVYWIVVLVAVLVAHAGLGAAIAPILGGLAWTYDAAFLLASLVPLVFLVTRLTVTVDPLSTIVADRIAGSPTDTDAPSAVDTDAPSATDRDR